MTAPELDDLLRAAHARGEVVLYAEPCCRRTFEIAKAGPDGKPIPYLAEDVPPPLDTRMGCVEAAVGQDFFEGRPSAVATCEIGDPRSAQAREDAIVMALGPGFFFERAMQAYAAAGLVRREERPLQPGLFDGPAERSAA